MILMFWFLMSFSAWFCYFRRGVRAAFAAPRFALIPVSILVHASPREAVQPCQMIEIFMRGTPLTSSGAAV